jgi:hypothetical protein
LSSDYTLVLSALRCDNVRDAETTKEHVVEPEPELILEDATSLRDAMRRVARYAADATAVLNARIADDDLDGKTEAGELREALEKVQNLSLEVSEALDAYQDRHAH